LKNPTNLLSRPKPGQVQQVLAFSILAIVLACQSVDAWQMKQAPLMTRWAGLVDTNNPLQEYPRPQLVRTNWLNLNGIWQFQPGATNDPVPVNQTLSSSILVPYPMESAISGVMQYSAFSWYRRTFVVPPAWSGKRIILHLDAVNWQAQVFINGQSLGIHKGGYDPFSYDITSLLGGGGTQELIVQVYDPVDNGGQPRGKQTLYPGGIMYTSSSGIWQPVWLEPVDATGIQNLVINPDVDNSRLRLTVNTYATTGVTISATALSNGIVVSTVTGNPATGLDLSIPNPKLWSPSSPFLYDLQISVLQGGLTNDTVASYFGMRKVSVVNVKGVPQIFVNNQPLFEMGPLDQGFWPDGIYTAPTDDALKYDLTQEKALGFNMVRKHIKVERQRWYYWADKLGLLVWQDMPSCNSYTGNPSPPAVDPAQFITELTRMVTNHWNSPAIIMWDVFNESQGQENTSGGVGQSSTASLVQQVKTLDPSRLVNQASGGSYYGVGDVLDNHSYPAPGNPTSTTQVPVDGEFGGIGFQLAGHLWNAALAGGNYTGADTLGDIAPIYDSFTTDLLNYKSTGGLNAAVYTQITDVENECNGLLTYDRLMKPDPLKILISNQKAITGQFSLATILPTSQTAGATWSYVTNYSTGTIPSNWYATNFNDAAWSSGPAGFGTSVNGAVVRTTWNTSDIWLRRRVALGAFTPNDLKNFVFNCFHDEDCEIYVNGVLAGSASGYSTAYVFVGINAAGLNALVPNATNLIAVHCHQTTGGQFIDVGISRQTITANALVVPVDYNGYWALDETTGTNAFDSSGNGNAGKVTNAVWNANGQLQGCLNFNGTNSAVQILRAISNDFTISLWVRTTQLGGSGQWYRGAGLVDGDFPFNANDFGTALSAGKFAFGIGNPDTTISSITPINDGAWHHCVATRVQSTGAISIYVDGNLETTGVGNTNPLTASGALLFGALASGGGYFNGSLDDVKIFPRALGGNEVAALYDNSAFGPPAPANLTALAGNAQVALAWNSSLTAASYNVSRSTVHGGPYTLIANTATTSYRDTSVNNGTTYYYVVSAVNAFGAGAGSVEVNALPYVLASWFKADAITGLVSGAALSVWPDSSGRTNHASQPNASQQPTYVTAAMNGLPVVRFNAAKSTYLAFNRPVQDDFTILCVFQSTQGSGSGNLYYQGAGLVNGEVGGVVKDFGACLFANGAVCAGTGNPDVAANSSAGYNDGHPHILTFKRTMSTGAVELFMDGSPVGTATGGTQPLTSPTQLVLGAQQTLIDFLTGDIAEVKIFDSPLSTADRMAEENILKCKYGLAGGTAPSAPAGLAGNPGNRAITLNWQASAGASGYNLWRSTNNGASYLPLATGLASTNFVDTNPSNGGTNYYAVASMNGCGTSVNSTAISVFLPLPVVTIQAGAGAGAGALTVSWPAWASDWNLWSATNLTPPIAWSRVTNSAGSTNGQLTLTLPTNQTNQFFRLTSP
jgi:hypothetical protein